LSDQASAALLKYVGLTQRFSSFREVIFFATVTSPPTKLRERGQEFVQNECTQTPNFEQPSEVVTCAYGEGVDGETDELLDGRRCERIACVRAVASPKSA
jgi:hypothetical protein